MATDDAHRDPARDTSPTYVEYPIDPAILDVVRHRLSSVAEAMGAALQRAAHSPNIKERRDYSCALFDGRGRLLAQAAHIPVHLGAMPASVAAARRTVDGCWQPGDVVVLNDPHQGGSHLPDLTTVSPVFVEGAEPEAHAQEPIAYLATRAHHADVGGSAPGSMGSAREVYGEGLILPPVHVQRAGKPVSEVMDLIAANSRTPGQRRGDMAAQLGAHHVGERWLQSQLSDPAAFRAQADALLEWSEALARAQLGAMPHGEACFDDVLEDDGQGGTNLAIQVCLRLAGADGIHADFSGTAAQAAGGVNAPRAVTLAALRYVAACLLPDVPHNAGGFAPLSLTIPRGSLLDPRPPAAVAAGNVETSQRVVDVLLGALAALLPDRIPAASQGTMNNVLAGGIDGTGSSWAYYETMGGGGGGAPRHGGASGRQCHMTNTRNTPVEALEMAIPIRVERYALRRGSGGTGRRSGGMGVTRHLRFMAPARVTLLAERRARAPFGVAGGSDGAPGSHMLRRAAAPTTASPLPAKTTFEAQAGDLLELHTPGGGGWGDPAEDRQGDGQSMEPTG